MHEQEATSSQAKKDDKGKSIKVDDKGKGKLPVDTEPEASRTSKSVRASISGRASMGGAPIPEYESVKDSFRFHEEISPTMQVSVCRFD